MEESENGQVSGCNLDGRELIEAVIHLNKALELLVFVNNEMIEQSVNGLDMIEKLVIVWEEINNCRVYTEENLYLEELLIPAMGLVNDARLMMESLLYWKLGMTLYGKISILTSIREAISSGIGPGIVRLESCMATV